MKNYKKVKTMDCGYCPYEFCPVMESDGEFACPYIKYVPEDEDKASHATDEEAV